MREHLVVAASLGLAASVVAVPPHQSLRAAQLEALPFAPRQAICYRTTAPPRIDGRLDDRDWSRSAWSDRFVDIEGDRRGPPRFQTRMKMLWDDEYFYVAAELEEPDVWGTLTARDSVIFHDNDFEVFIDPDGDTHQYYELEVNALGTAWDLMLVRPYRDGGPPLDAWDIAGLQVGIQVRGTINRPGDRDDGWDVELAMPWKVLREAAPDRKRPAAGERWRINFSRVEWQTEVRDGRYRKKQDAATGADLAEDNWVWTPQGAIDMHMPERWGFVLFTDTPPGSPVALSAALDATEHVKWALRRLYYRQRDLLDASGRYAIDLAALNVRDVKIEGVAFTPALQATASMYEISAPGATGSTVHLRQDGRVWVTR